MLEITQEESVAARVGDKLKGRVAFVTGGTRGNLSGSFFLSQAALRHMAERGSGRIVTSRA